MYKSLATIALTITILTILLTYLINRKNPFRVFSTLKNQKQIYLHLGLLAIILFVNKLELQLESTFTNPADFSGLFFSYEHTILPVIRVYIPLSSANRDYNLFLYYHVRHLNSHFP